MLKIDWKEGFFDREAVLKAVGKARRGVLNEYGRRVRKRAQTSLKYSESSSMPGDPPHAHKSGKRRRVSKKTGKVRIRDVSPLREFLWYAYDRATDSVVSGPAGMSSTLDDRTPAALEYGGTTIINDHGERRQVDIDARPFMGPAAAATNDELPSLWLNSVR